MQAAKKSWAWLPSASALLAVATALCWTWGHAFRVAYLRGYGLDHRYLTDTFQELVYAGAMQVAGPWIAVGLGLTVLALVAMSWLNSWTESRGWRWPTIQLMASHRWLWRAMCAFATLLILAGILLLIRGAEEAGRAKAQQERSTACSDHRPVKDNPLAYVVLEAKAENAGDDEGFLIACSSDRCAIFTPGEGDAPVREVMLSEIRAIHYLAKPPDDACEISANPADTAVDQSPRLYRPRAI
jgi:MFS family permease